MDQIHCERIDDLIEMIPYAIAIIALWPHLIQIGIFNRGDRNTPIRSRNLRNPDTTKHKIFLKKVMIIPEINFNEAFNGDLHFNLEVDLQRSFKVNFVF